MVKVGGKLTFAAVVKNVSYSDKAAARDMLKCRMQAQRGTMISETIPFDAEAYLTTQEAINEFLRAALEAKYNNFIYFKWRMLFVPKVLIN